MARLTIRIDLGEAASFGPGKARLLELLDDVGSIRRAAAAMDMSYRRAWLLVQEIETIMGSPVIAAETGGAAGGGTKLTPLGRKVLAHYRAIERRATTSVRSDLDALVAMAGGARGARTVPRPLKRKARAKRGTGHKSTKR